MATTAPTKPTIKGADVPPFKAATEAAPPRAAAETSAWKPIKTAPQDADARFMVRATKDGEPVKGTETVVHYRSTRVRIGGRWSASLAMIHDVNLTKLGFRPNEWREIEKTDG